jgi:hypothetical protein
MDKFNFEQLNNGMYLIKDNCVWYKPHIEIKMGDGINYKKYFETVAMLENFLNSESLNTIKWCKMQ